MDETNLDQIVNAWIAAEDAECGSPEHEANWWAFEELTKWFRERQGEFVWRFITAAYKRNLSDKVFGALAAGPLEDLLAEQGPEFIDGVEELARTDSRFNYLLGGVWRSSMTEEVWQRVQAARLNIW